MLISHFYNFWKRSKQLSFGRINFKKLLSLFNRMITHKAYKNKIFGERIDSQLKKAQFYKEKDFPN